ncbi:hypothetical protein [Polynucleobacter necessarius]|uniref:hypothetical protein n=1 Tax=Polynucleobacter necessarius TaxID=576610 RepID=UPI001E51ECD1|nr:hypothetical protein [Polynucleobacter necessarius]
MRLVVRSGSETQFSQYQCVESIVSSINIFAENEQWWEKRVKALIPLFMLLGIQILVIIYSPPEIKIV